MSIPHAIDRAYTRYGLKLDIDDLRALSAGIRRNEGTLVARLEDGKSAWAIECKGKLCKIVMASDLYTVMTFLPPSYDGPTNPKDRPRERTFQFFRAGKKCFGERGRAKA